MMRKDAAQKVVLITGAAKGIGRAIAMAFAGQGYSVAVNYRTSAAAAGRLVRDLNVAGAPAISIRADVSDPRQVKKMFARIRDRFGALDVLINNAGWTTYVPDRMIETLAARDCQRILNVNIAGAFFCSQAALPLLRQAGNAAIINIASDSAFTAEGSNLVYAASKAAVVSLTASFARALAPRIRVNAIAPGYVRTDFIKGIPEGKLQAAIQRSPGKRFASCEDIAKTAVALAERLPFTTGQIVSV